MKDDLQANENCPYCDAKAIHGAVLHEPNCPTWDMVCDETKTNANC